MSKVCPRCKRRSMVRCGQVRAGPRRGLRTVYRCRRCRHQRIA